jgi:hypothetical protein
MTARSQKRSALSHIPRSRLALVPAKRRKGRGSTIDERIDEFAKIDWKPWKRPRALGRGFYPTPKDMHYHAVTCRIAHGVMLRTRDQLIQSYSELERGNVDQLLAGLPQTAEWLKEMAAMVESAHIRMLAAACTAHKQGTLFAGEKKKRARRK